MSNCRMSFELLATDGKARRGRLTFPRGVVETPAFMPVGTYGTVKGMLPRDIEAIGAQMILGNTFHLWLRPGTEVIKKHGDLHDFMKWQGHQLRQADVDQTVGVHAGIATVLSRRSSTWSALTPSATAS